MSWVVSEVCWLDEVATLLQLIAAHRIRKAIDVMWLPV